MYKECPYYHRFLPAAKNNIILYAIPDIVHPIFGHPNVNFVRALLSLRWTALFCTSALFPTSIQFLHLSISRLSEQHHLLHPFRCTLPESNAFRLMSNAFVCFLPIYHHPYCLQYPYSFVTGGEYPLPYLVTIVRVSTAQNISRFPAVIYPTALSERFLYNV